ncbi:MAG: hypothetical protein HXX13_03915 [Bacteroidetes bacterium]|nr:hypothetical protein [Bacteroidota bacterium]
MKRICVCGRGWGDIKQEAASRRRFVFIDTQSAGIRGRQFTDPQDPCLLTGRSVPLPSPIRKDSLT